MLRLATTGSRMLCIFAVCSALLLFAVSCREKKENHLSKASSPYLKAQAGDPVDWYEWGGDAMQKAKKEDKPLLVSVGYSACHWCHMMEKESFTDSAVARIMNENFVCIKVDREERPDIDNMYSEACRLIAGSTGWPLNAFALPDGKPFFAGTYYSKQGWINILGQIATAYRSQRNKVDLQAQSLSNGIADPGIVIADSNFRSDGKKTYQQLFVDLYRKMDLSNGGLQGTPKFPMPSCLEFAMQYYFVSGDRRALDATTNTLTKMALGGIYDQLGGGFARYTTDSLWHVPHFEKMLCDNAQLLSVYAHAYQITHNDLFKDVIHGITGFIQRDLRGQDGGYFASLDADTQAGEGDFYAWSVDEVKKVLPDDYGLFADYYHVSADGNWKEGKNILFASETPMQFGEAKRKDPGILSGRLEADRQKLLLEREKRARPSVDEKIITSWNALLMCGYLDAYAALGEPVYLQYALRTAILLDRGTIQEGGKLQHVVKEGKSHVDGFLDDYAFLAIAYLRLYELSFSTYWLDRAKQLADQAIGQFFDPVSGMFFYAGQQTDSAVIRKIEIDDSNIPSSNAVMAEVLYKLGHYFENQDFLDKSSVMLSGIQDQLSRNGAVYYAKWASLSGFFVHGVNEVAIVGKDALAKDLDMQKAFLPLSLFMGSTGKEDLPLLEGKTRNGQTLIYICTNKVCKRPVAGTIDALGLLQKKPGQ